MREKRLYFRILMQKTRITPACAGKTAILVSQSSRLQDHPRVCGKNPLIAPNAFWKPGSPPRVREKLETDFEPRKKSGITPACAGKTHRHYLQRLVPWDHPRVCGKNFFTTREVSLGLGSPPRVREKH